MNIGPKIGIGMTNDSSVVNPVGFRPGERVRHDDLGEGIVLGAPVEGFIKVFFPPAKGNCRLRD